MVDRLGGLGDGVVMRGCGLLKPWSMDVVSEV